MKKTFSLTKVMIFCLILVAGLMSALTDASAVVGPCVQLLECNCVDASTCEGPNGNQAACTFTILNCGALPIVNAVLELTLTDGAASPAVALPGDSLSPAVNNSDGGLEPGDSATLNVDILGPPGDYAYSATVTATDEFGGEATDSCNGTFSIAMCVPADIKPMSCPNPLSLMDRGVLPVALLGTPEFDVTTIDPATIQLEGVAPLRWSVKDVAAPYTGDADADCMSCTINGEDGFPDLTLKFDAREVIAALGNVSDGECLLVTLTGNLKAEFGGAPILAHDVLLIIDRGK